MCFVDSLPSDQILAVGLNECPISILTMISYYNKTIDHSVEASNLNQLFTMTLIICFCSLSCLGPIFFYHGCLVLYLAAYVFCVSPSAPALVLANMLKQNYAYAASTNVAVPVHAST